MKLTDNELPIDITVQLDEQSRRKFEQDLRQMAESAVVTPIGPAEARVIAAESQRTGQPLFDVATAFKRAQLAAQDLAVQMEHAARQARRASEQMGAARLKSAGLQGGADELAVGQRQQYAIVGGRVGTILGRQGSYYEGNDAATAFQYAQDQAQLRSRRQAFRTSGQMLAGVLPDEVQLAAELVKAGNAQRRDLRTLAAYAAAGGQLDPSVASQIPGDLRGQEQRKVARRERTEKLRQEKEAIDQEIGPLEDSIRYAQARKRAQDRKNRAYQDAARAEAEAPGTLDAATRDLLRQNRPGLLEQEQAAHRQAQIEEQNAERRRRTRDYLNDSNVSFFDRFQAGVRGYAPGDKGSRGPFGGDFLQGLFGRDGSLEHSLGQAVKFSVLYGGLYQIQNAITRGFAAAATGAAQYEQALIALNLATGEASESNERLAQSTARIATDLGLVPQAGVQAAAQAIGLYDLNNANAYDRQAIAEQSTAVAGRLSIISGKDMGAVQSNIAGLVRSFGMSSYEQGRVEDMATVIQRQTGTSAGDLLDAATQLGTIASEAGYDLADTFAMISQAQRLTGQTANAVAGQLSQALSKAGDPATQAAFASVGVNVTGTTYAQQVAELATKRDTLDPDTYKRVVQSVGRSRSGAVFDILLSQQGSIQGLAQEARNAPEGAGEEAFAQTLESLTGQLRKIGALFAHIGVEIANAGLLTHLQRLATLFGAMIAFVDRLVSLYGDLPAPLRDFITTATEVVVVMKLLKLAAAAQVSTRATAGATRLLDTLAGALGLSAAGQAAGGGLKGAAAGFGRGTRGSLGRREGPLTEDDTRSERRRERITQGGVAGIAFVGAAAASLYGASQAERDTRNAFEAARNAAGAAGTAEELRDAAARFAQAGEEARAQGALSAENFLQQGLVPFIQYMLNPENNVSARRAREADRAAAELDERSDRIEKARQDAIQANPANAFQSFASVQSVSDSLGTLATQGYSAKRQLDALNEAFETMIELGETGGAKGVVNAGAGEEFSTSVGAAPGKALDAIRRRYQSEREQFGENDADWFSDLVSQNTPSGGEGFWNMAFNSDYEIRKGKRDQAQAALDFLDNINIKPIQDAVASDAQGVLNGATRDRSGRVLLSEKDIQALQDSARGRVREGLGPERAADQELVDQLVSITMGTLMESLAPYITKPATIETATAYAQNALAKAQESAEAAGNLALFTNNPTAGPDALVAEMETARANILAYASRMPEDTEYQREAKLRFIEDSMASIDGQLRVALSAQFDARFKSIDSITKLNQSQFALGDDFSRQVAELEGIKRKQELLLGTPINGVTQEQYAKSLKEYDDAVAAQKAAEAAEIEAADEAYRRDGRGDRLVDRRRRRGEGPEREKKPRSLLTEEQRKKTMRNLPEEDRRAMADADVLPKPTPKPKPAAPEKPKYVDPNSDEARELQAARNAAELQIAAGEREARKLAAQLRLAPADAVGLAALDVQEAQEAVADARARKKAGTLKGDLFLRQQELKLREASARYQQERANQGNLSYQLSLNVDDPLASTRTQLDLATRNLQLANRGLLDRKQAQLAYNKALYDMSMAEIDLAAQLRDDYDRTDPVQRAQAEIDALNQKLAAATDPGAKKLLQLQIEDRSIDQQVSASQQRVKDIETAEALDRITKEEAQKALVAEKARVDAQLAGMTTQTNGYRALKDQSDSLAKSIKAASESYSGQFNLRDIKLPTVYEIRRSMGGDMTGRASQVVTTTNNVEINGADFARVVSYLDQLIGRSSPRTRGLIDRWVG